VGELGDLLELLYSAHSSFETVRGVLRRTTDSDLSERAMREFVEQEQSGTMRSSVIVLGRPDAEPTPSRRVAETRFWHEKPNRFREAITSDHPDGRDGWVAVRDGDRWWSFDPRNGGHSNEDDPEVGSGVGHELAALLDPVDLLAAFELTILGRSEVFGRGAIDLRAVSRKTEHHRFHSFPPWGDELRCSVDADRGVLLRKAFLIDGAEFVSEELSELAFDEPIPPETFVLELPEGESFASLDHYVEPVTLPDAVARASFKVFAVRKLPEGDWRIQVHYSAAGRHPPEQESVHINYMREDAQSDLAISESSAGAPAVDWPDDFDDEAVVRDGISYLVHSGEEGPFGPPATVRFDRDGTRIEMSSNALGVPSLLDLAAELVEVER
jgi:outer membrane lipoprotein-sorting protein